MSKERLRKIEKDVNKSDENQLDKISKKKFKDYTLEDYVFLHEQAERVQELEELIEDYKTVNKELHDRRKKLRKQNKRYREALEEIATRKMSTFLNQSSMNEHFIRVARKALEGKQ